MTVSLEKGEAVITPKPGKSFNPSLIRKAVNDAGFTAGEVRLTARGKLVQYDKFLALKVPTLEQVIVMEGGNRSDELRQKSEFIGREFTVSGRLHPSHGDQPPGMTVDNWRLMGTTQ